MNDTPAAVQLTLWRNNRLDARHEIPIDEIADLYLDSTYKDLPYPLERSVALFLTDPAGPISSVWEPADPAYEQLLELILTRRDRLSHQPDRRLSDPNPEPTCGEDGDG